VLDANRSGFPALTKLFQPVIGLYDRQRERERAPQQRNRLSTARSKRRFCNFFAHLVSGRLGRNAGDP